MGLLDKIQRTNTAGTANRLKALLYSLSGGGKTFSVSTLPDHDRVLVVSTEGGLLTLQSFSIPCIEITSTAELREVCAEVRRSGAWSWIVLDSATNLAEKTLAAEMAKEEALGNKANGQRAYGRLATLMTEAITDLLSLPCNVLCLALQEKVQDDESRLFRGPSFPGKVLTTDVPAWFDLVFALRVSQDQDGTMRRWFQTRPDASYLAKDRSGRLDASEPVDWAHVAAKCGFVAAPVAQPADDGVLRCPLGAAKGTPLADMPTDKLEAMHHYLLAKDVWPQHAEEAARILDAREAALAAKDVDMHPLDAAVLGMVASGELLAALVGETPQPMPDMPRKHVYFKCPPGACVAGDRSCNYCDGGLAYCTVCKRAEGELAYECPGEPVPDLAPIAGLPLVGTLPERGAQEPEHPTPAEPSVEPEKAKRRPRGYRQFGAVTEASTTIAGEPQVAP